MAHVPVKRGRGDTGASLVMALAVVLIVFTLGAVWLAWADHQTDASRYDRDRQRSIDAANAGVAAAQVRLSTDGGASVLGVAQSGSVGGAEYDYLITEASPTQRLVTAWGYAPSKASSMRAVRTMQQTIELDISSAGSFQFAFQAGQTSTMEPTLHVTGDVYIHGDFNSRGATMVGNVYATSSVNQNPNVTGDVYAGLDANVQEVHGNVYAGGNVSIRQQGQGQVYGNVQAGGTVSACSRVTGACQQNSTSVPPVPSAQLPTFTWDPADYPAGSQTWTGTDVFKTWAMSQSAGIAGAHLVDGDMNFGANDTLRVAGDVTIYHASGTATLPKRIENVAGQEVDVRFILEGTQSWTMSGSFTVDATINLLLYSTLASNLTNKCVFHGSVVTPETISGGSNCDVTFAEVDGTGFTFPGVPTVTYYVVRSVSLREVAGIPNP